MVWRALKSCWLHLRQQKRGPRRWIASIALLQIVTVFIVFRSTNFLRKSYYLEVAKAQPESLLRPSVSGPKIDFEEKRVITLEDDEWPHFQQVGKAPLCYVEGTDVASTLSANSSECYCRKNFYGKECGIPSAVWHRTISKKYGLWPLKPRKVPRRIIHGLNINHETDFFRVRLEELKDAVDAYIVCESNYSAHGDPKPLYLLDKLRSGFMEKFHTKIIHVPLYKFPRQGHKRGWLVDMYLRTYMGIYGLNRIRGVRSDDLFVLLDADEIPTREVLMFLKLYDGYPEPIRLAMRWSVFGFFWKRKKNVQSESLLDWIFNVMSRDRNQDEEELLEVTAVSTMGMVWEVCKNNTFLIRKDMSDNQEFQEDLSEYQNDGHLVSAWTAGTKEHYAGFHCSWCYNPEGIRTKLLSAHVDDKPRWGDFPEKLDLNYIHGLIRKGEWFDGTHPFFMSDWEKEEQYAPKYILEHPQEFTQLLYPDMTNLLYSSQKS